MEKNHTSRSPGRPSTADGAAVRGRLLDATFELIAEQGVAATSIAQIAARAQVTPAMIHYYFRNRELLLDAVVAERLACVISKVWGPVVANMDPFALVEGIARRFADVATTIPQLPALWLREIVSDGGLLRNRVFKHLPLDKVALLNEAVIHGQYAGQINPKIDARYMFLTIMGLIMMPLAVSALFERITRQRIDVDGLVEHAVALLHHGMDIPTHPPSQRKRS